MCFTDEQHIAVSNNSRLEQELSMQQHASSGSAAGLTDYYNNYYMLWLIMCSNLLVLYVQDTAELHTGRVAVQSTI